MKRSIDEILSETAITELDLGQMRSVEPSAPLEEVYRVLEECRRGAVVVTQEGRVKGIFTERDVLYRTSREELDPATPIAQLMIAEPQTLNPEESLAEAIHAMVEGGYRHIPLVDERGHYAGLMSSRDVLRFIADHFADAVLNLPPRLHQHLSRPEGG
jgi:signal-transduction protein with cAMP-binding, CBS, and nucleotidyltransferase domain